MASAAQPAGARRPRETLGQWVKETRVRWFVAGLAAGVALCLAGSLLRTLVWPEPELEPGHLVIMMDVDPSIGQQRHRLIREWADAHPEYSVEIREVPGTATAAHSQLVAQAQSGAGEVDIYSLDVTWIAEFAEEDWITPLDRSTVDEGAFLARPFAAGEYDGELYALPFNTDVGLLFYRRDLLGDDVPETWDQLVAMAGERQPAGFEAWYAGQLADYEGFTVNLLETVLAEHPDALRDGGEFPDTCATIDAANRLGAGLLPGESGIPLIDPASLAYSEDGTRAAFQQGRVPLMRNWPIAYRLLTTAAAADQPPLAPEQVGVTRLPSAGEDRPGRGVLGGQSLAVAASTDQPTAAQALIEHLTDARSQEILFAEGGFAPTQRIVYSNEEYDGHPYLAVLREAVEDASPRPIHPRYEAVSEALRRVVRGHLAAVDPSQGATDAGGIRTDLTEEREAALEGRRG